MANMNTATLPATFGKEGFGTTVAAVNELTEFTTGNGITVDVLLTLLAGMGITAGNFTITAGELIFSAATSKIVPGATSISLRNNADNADNLIVTDAGAVTTRNSLTVTAGGITITAGGLRITSGSSTDGSPSTLQTGAANGETINTAGLGLARYKTNGAARTGVILQAGTYDGQVVTVVNEDGTAANSITFAAVATSNVANGTTCVINGLQGRRFSWSANASTPAWYELK